MEDYDFNRANYIGVKYRDVPAMSDAEFDAFYAANAEEVISDTWETWNAQAMAELMNYAKSLRDRAKQ